MGGMLAAVVDAWEPFDLSWSFNVVVAALVGLMVGASVFTRSVRTCSINKV
jgi:hypothetical protein